MTPERPHVDIEKMIDRSHALLVKTRQQIDETLEVIRADTDGASPAEYEQASQLGDSK